ncbi:hypothetical protein TNCV_3218151 [Trichonephila clavipes]|nr:hypothetical protein TNCV_3218151 [Trichonephila clavipes]
MVEAAWSQIRIMIQVKSVKTQTSQAGEVVWREEYLLHTQCHPPYLTNGPKILETVIEAPVVYIESSALTVIILLKNEVVSNIQIFGG